MVKVYCIREGAKEKCSGNGNVAACNATKKENGQRKQNAKLSISSCVVAQTKSSPVSPPSDPLSLSFSLS